METYKFYIESDGDYEAGILPYTENITVTVENEAGGEDGEFDKFLKDMLAEWFDGASVETKAEADARYAEIDKVFGDD